MLSRSAAAGFMYDMECGGVCAWYLFLLFLPFSLSFLFLLSSCFRRLGAGLVLALYLGNCKKKRKNPRRSIMQYQRNCNSLTRTKTIYFIPFPFYSLLIEEGSLTWTNRLLTQNRAITRGHPPPPLLMKIRGGSWGGKEKEKAPSSSSSSSASSSFSSFSSYPPTLPYRTQVLVSFFFFSFLLKCTIPHTVVKLQCIVPATKAGSWRSAFVKLSPIESNWHLFPSFTHLPGLGYLLVSTAHTRVPFTNIPDLFSNLAIWQDRFTEKHRPQTTSRIPRSSLPSLKEWKDK